jgi:hypothetical protein
MVMASVLNQSWSWRNMSQGACFGKGYFFSRGRLQPLKRYIVPPTGKIVRNSSPRGMRCETPQSLSFPEKKQKKSPLRAGHSSLSRRETQYLHWISIKKLFLSIYPNRISCFAKSPHFDPDQSCRGAAHPYQPLALKSAPCVIPPGAKSAGIGVRRRSRSDTQQWSLAYGRGESGNHS